MKYTALILAGNRDGQEDSVAKAANVSCKALAEIAGVPMIERVITALKSSGEIENIIVSIPENIRFENPSIERISTEKSPVRSLLKAIQTLKNDQPIIITTADHALLSAHMIKSFINKYESNRFDTAVAMLPLQILKAKYPETKRTALKLKDGSFKSCNLFIFKNKTAAHNILSFWRALEDQRKTPWKMVRHLGPLTLLQYLTGQLTLQSALSHLGKITKTTPQAVMLDIPEAAIDVDMPTDLEFVRAIATH